MSNEILSFDELDMNELTEADLAIIRAFETMEVWPPDPSLCQTEKLKVSQACSQQEDEEMLLIFIAEAEAELSAIRQMFGLLAQNEPENLALFTTLKRAGHKLHGTAGAIGFPLISTVAGHIELIAEAVLRNTISAPIGMEAICAAATVLEACLQAITSTHEELEASPLLASLATVYQSLHIDLQQLEQNFTAKQAIKTEKSPPSTFPLPLNPQYLEHLPLSDQPLPTSTIENHHNLAFFLIVRVENQHLLIPCNQIQCISNTEQQQTDICYSLQELLNLPSQSSPQPIAKPQESTNQHLLILHPEDETLSNKTAGIIVDEVLGEQECIIEPLFPYLQRPGIASSTIDDESHVRLVVDIMGLLLFREDPQSLQ